MWTGLRESDHVGGQEDACRDTLPEGSRTAHRQPLLRHCLSGEEHAGRELQCGSLFRAAQPKEGRKLLASGPQLGYLGQHEVLVHGQLFCSEVEVEGLGLLLKWKAPPILEHKFKHRFHCVTGEQCPHSGACDWYIRVV